MHLRIGAEIEPSRRVLEERAHADACHRIGVHHQIVCARKQDVRRGIGDTLLDVSKGLPELPIQVWRLEVARDREVGVRRVGPAEAEFFKFVVARDEFGSVGAET